MYDPSETGRLQKTIPVKKREIIKYTTTNILEKEQEIAKLLRRNMKSSKHQKSASRSKG